MSAASKTSQFATTANCVLNQSIPRLSASRPFTPHPHRGLRNCPAPKDRPPGPWLCNGMQSHGDHLIRCPYPASMENLVEIPKAANIIAISTQLTRYVPRKPCANPEA